MERAVPARFYARFVFKRTGTARSTCIKHPSPHLRSFAKLFHNRIATDISGLLQIFLHVPEPVIKKVLLPPDTMPPGLIPLPLAEDTGHHAVLWKRNQRMEMIRHQKNK